eukprot:CCRYP_003856-RA/>CCRYP_003856-RA protein AED:0.00 eAED:0.00 QI:92/1/0.5/1/0/0/2/0/36
MFILAPSRSPEVKNSLSCGHFPTLKCGLCLWLSPGL